jgi:hypothetical protein
LAFLNRSTSGDGANKVSFSVTNIECIHRTGPG